MASGTTGAAELADFTAAENFERIGGTGPAAPPICAVAAPSALTGVVCCVLQSRGVPHAVHAVARAEFIKVHIVHDQRPNDAGSAALMRASGSRGRLHFSARGVRQAR